MGLLADHSSVGLNPDCPCCEAIHECEREVCDNVAADAFTAA